jgi:hypothetical protein
MKHIVAAVACTVCLFLADSSMAGTTPAAAGNSNQWTWDDHLNFGGRPRQNQNSLGHFTYDVRMCCRYIPMDPDAPGIEVQAPHVDRDQNAVPAADAKTKP